MSPSFHATPSATIGPNKLPELNKERFVIWLIDWYQIYKRELPWRTTKDPYKIWLSEVILQQTRVAQGVPYYELFIKNYPTVSDLARADEKDVLRLWQGLGYYARARNLHACARMISDELGGIFPNTYQALLQLKGVGKYTAAAIASIAFQESVPVVDGNVYRVLARVFGITEDVKTVQGTRTFYTLAQSLIPQENADLYNQAIMEFGALHCTPSRPRCGSCMFQTYCTAFRTNRQHSLPVKTKKLSIRSRFFHYFVIQHGDSLYMKQRTERDIWEGLYDFYLLEDDQPSSLDQSEDLLVRLIRLHKPYLASKPDRYRHLLTHQRLHVHFWRIRADTQFVEEAASLLDQAEMQTFTISQIQTLPKPILIENFLERYFYS